MLVEALTQGYSRITHPGQSVLLAVSGGVDSTALLVASAQAAEKTGLLFRVACVDHGLRPESAQELEGVAALAKAHGLAFTGVQVRVPPGGNLESEARRVRYEALDQVRQEKACDLVATAHTATDQAETLVMRLLRGSSLRGAAAVREQRARVVRPMLKVTRADCEAFLRAQNVPWFTDEMNDDPRFFRTRVRNDVLPLFDRITDPGAVLRLSEFAELAAQDEDFLESLAAQALDRACTNGSRESLRVETLRSEPLPILRRALRRWLTDAGIPFDGKTLQRMAAAIEQGGRCQLPTSKTFACAGGIARVERPAEKPEACLLGPGETVEFGGWRLSWADAPVKDALNWPAPAGGLAKIRARAPGDRILGPHGSRKVQDLLVNAKTPREARDAWPLVCDPSGDQPLWLVGIWPSPPAYSAGPCVCAQRL